MKCILCKTKMIPFGSPAERRGHPGHTIYSCPRCHTVAGAVRMLKKRKADK